MATTQTPTCGREWASGRWFRSRGWSLRPCTVQVTPASRTWETAATSARSCRSSLASPSSREREYLVPTMHWGWAVWGMEACFEMGDWDDQMCRYLFYEWDYETQKFRVFEINTWLKFDISSFLGTSEIYRGYTTIHLLTQHRTLPHKCK